MQLNELTVIRASLKEALMELTADSVDSGPGPPETQGQPAGPGQPGAAPGTHRAPAARL